MQAHRVPARRGLDWIVEGYRLFRRSPSMVLLLIFAYLSMLGLAAALPLVGNCVMAMLLPALSVGPLAAFRQLDRGEPVTFDSLFTGFRNNFPTLLRLGVLYLLSLGVSLLLSALVDDGQYLKSVLFSDASPEPAAPAGAPAGEAQKNAEEAAQLSGAELVFIAALFPGAVGLWFAPMLAAWHRLPALQSLFFAIVACLRNYRAFFLYLAGLLAVCFVGASFIAAFSVLLSGVLPDARRALGLMMVMILFVVVTSANYLSYRDIFFDGASTADVPPDPAPASPPDSPPESPSSGGPTDPP